MAGEKSLRSLGRNGLFLGICRDYGLIYIYPHYYYAHGMYTS